MTYKLTFAGTGSAFTVGHDNYHSNMIFESDDNARMLIDCGTDARHSLYELGLTYKDIDHVYISHLHADHAGGLEWLGFSRYFDPNCTRPKLYLSEKLANDLWQKSLSAGMNVLKEKEAQLNDFFEIQLLNDSPFTWHGCSFQLVKAKHVTNIQKSAHCYGLFIKTENQNIYITADTQFCPELLMPYYEQADIIFQDCNVIEPRSPVHANYQDLKTLPTSIKQKMWLYHYSTNNLPDPQKDHFQGFVKKAQIFNI